MTTIKVPATTLTFDHRNVLLRSKFCGFEVRQQWLESQPDKYIAIHNDDPETVFVASSLGGIISDVIQFHYEHA